MTTSRADSASQPTPPLVMRNASPARRSISVLIPALLLWLAAWIGLLAVDPPGGVLEVELSAQTPRIAQARVYFDRGSDINLADSATAWLQPGHNTLRFPIGAGTITRFRLDTHHGSGPIHIRSVRLWPAHHRSAHTIPLDRVGAGDQIEHIHLDANGMTIQPTHGTGLPKLWIEPAAPITVPDASSRPLLAAVSAALLVLVGLMLWRWALARNWSWRTGVGLSLLTAFALAGIMACQSPTGIPTHPDELAHLWCFQYFLTHLFPPAVDDPEVIQTLSVYGFSYLFELDVVYALAARSVGALSAWFNTDLSAARSFNLALLLGLACLAWHRPRWAIGLSVLLLSPQIWYVFAYFNADAFPLFLAIVAACIVADHHSGLNRYVDDRQRIGIGVWIFILVLGLLLLSKRNYLPIIPVFGLWLAVRHLDMSLVGIGSILSGLLAMGASVHLKALPGWAASGGATTLLILGALMAVGATATMMWGWWRNDQLRPRFKRLVSVFALALAVAAPRIVLDVIENGAPGQKADTIEQIAEIHAGGGFKPSQLETDSAYPGRALVLRGTRLDEIAFAPHHWLHDSLNSAFGVYGYTIAYPPKWILQSLQLLTLIVMAVAAVGLYRRRDGKATRLLLIFLGGCLLVFANTLLHSWTFDLQRQGRYLFPIFAMLALMLGSAAENLPSKLVGTLTTIAFVLGCVSFIGTALPALSHHP